MCAVKNCGFYVYVMIRDLGECLGQAVHHLFKDLELAVAGGRFLLRAVLNLLSEFNFVVTMFRPTLKYNLLMIHLANKSRFRLVFSSIRR